MLKSPAALSHAVRHHRYDPLHLGLDLLGMQHGSTVADDLDRYPVNLGKYGSSEIWMGNIDGDQDSDGASQSRK